MISKQYLRQGINKMKYLAYIFIATVMATVINSCQTTNQIDNHNVDPDNPATFRLFSILASTDDDPVFIKVLEEMNIDPMPTYYCLVVNISDKNPDKHYAKIYDKVNPFSSLSKETQERLIGWCGTNKSNVLDVWRDDKLKTFDR
jgi:hypothetical protein